MRLLVLFGALWKRGGRQADPVCSAGVETNIVGVNRHITETCAVHTLPALHACLPHYIFLLLLKSCPNLSIFHFPTYFPSPFPTIFRTSSRTEPCDAPLLENPRKTRNEAAYLIHHSNHKYWRVLMAATPGWQTSRNKRGTRWTREPANRSGLGAKAGRRRCVSELSTMRTVTRRQHPRGLTALGQDISIPGPSRAQHARSIHKSLGLHSMRHSQAQTPRESPSRSPQAPPPSPKHPMPLHVHSRVGCRHAAWRCILNPAAMAEINCLFSLPCKASACCKRPILTETSEVAVWLSQILGSRLKPLSRTVAWQPHRFEVALKVWASGRVV